MYAVLPDGSLSEPFLLNTLWIILIKSITNINNAAILCLSVSLYRSVFTAFYDFGVTPRFSRDIMYYI